MDQEVHITADQEVGATVGRRYGWSALRLGRRYGWSALRSGALRLSAWRA
ncbi:MAG: hypothetical protein WB424_13530 [Terracidiphilus sp.]